MIAARFMDAERGAFSRHFAAFATKQRPGATISERENAAVAWDHDGVPYFRRKEVYFFFLALAFLPALATFAAFFFAAIVSTSPDIGMVILSASIL
jgi:hypothetical protein